MGHEPQATVGTRPGGTRQPRQDPVGREPRRLVRVVHEERGARRRTQHAGLAHDLAQEAVDQRGLPGPGGPADDGEQRRAQLTHPRQQVVVELGAQPVGEPSVVVRPRESEGQTQVRDRGAQVGQRGEHPPSVDLRPRHGRQSRVSLRYVTRCGRAASAPRRDTLLSSYDAKLPSNQYQAAGSSSVPS